MSCIAGTEEETGGDGAGEVSTGVESESVVRKRRAVVTRRLIPLAGMPQYCLPAANSSQTRSQLLEKAFDGGIFCSNEYYSSITPRLLHVRDSILLVLDQYTGDLSSSFIHGTRHQLVSLCCSLVEEEKDQLLGPIMTS